MNTDETKTTWEERYRQAALNSDRAFDGFGRRILVHKIEDLDREIAETRCWIAKHGPDERDIEFIRLAENLHVYWIKELRELDRKKRDTDRPQKSLGEVMIEASGKPRSLTARPDTGQLEETAVALDVIEAKAGSLRGPQGVRHKMSLTVLNAR
jgi:hypothetical protein